MTCLAFCGLRGGTGTTSTVAATGAALLSIGAKVLLIDLSPENLLRLHFGVPYVDRHGWGRSWLDGHTWHEAICDIQPGLGLLPFGGLTGAEHKNLPDTFQAFLPAWRDHLSTLADCYDMVLIDTPAGERNVWPLILECGLRVITMEADPACFILLTSLPRHTYHHCLITRYDPHSRLQRDIRLSWQGQLGDVLLEQVIHRDESMAEALGQKQTVGSYCPDSLAARDASNLASWCLTHAGAHP
ncbi:cellulose synthase operon protein YhjQ [Alcaligenaceae bacterium CGII-47]|nr:cellulose synthase operon protein YhjQ [Alcaligenaceae bacterium CGII-47]